MFARLSPPPNVFWEESLWLRLLFPSLPFPSLSSPFNSPFSFLSSLLSTSLLPSPFFFLSFPPLVSGKQDRYGWEEPPTNKGDLWHPPDEGAAGEHCHNSWDHEAVSQYYSRHCSVLALVRTNSLWFFWTNHLSVLPRHMHSTFQLKWNQPNVFLESSDLCNISSSSL